MPSNSVNFWAILLCLIGSSWPSLSIISGRDNATITTDPPNANLSQPDQNNITFQYEANEFLINNQQAFQTTTTKPSEKLPKPKSESKVEKPEAASLDSTSARNGRMLDLDALMGDFAASKANRERSLSGNRQSRFLNAPDLPNGKRLHIQGFIPIVGIKDISEETQTSSLEHEFEALRKQQRSNLGLQSAVELPYAQSSIGHASFGVQRYLNTDQPASNQQIISKPATVADTLRKPFKRLSNGLSIGSVSDVLPTSGASSNQQSECLCVPFYMCKNGFISESGLSKSQIQQMIQTQSSQIDAKQTNYLQQQQHLQAQTVIPTQQPQFADSAVSVDERSLNGESSLASASQSSSLEDIMAGYQNETANRGQLDQSSVLAASSPNETPIVTVAPAELTNMTTSSDGTIQSSDYTQEILGRMLGIGKTSSPKAATNSLPQSGTCGLLRSCCSIPPQMLQSNQHHQPQQDYATSASVINPVYTNQVSMPPNQQPTSRFQLQPSQMQRFNPNNNMIANQQSIQRYQQQVQMQKPQQAYGLPAQALSQVVPQSEFTLAHRSVQLGNQVQAYNPVASASMIQQTRTHPTQVASPNQQLIYTSHQPAKLQPYLPPTNLQLSTQMDLHQQPTSNYKTQSLMAQPLGKRKILEGRCGLRQSVGINGRVQNLAYHESSADFGEYPAQVAILKKLTGSDSLFVCGGTLISQYWIATAAHCIKKHAQSEFKVRLGEWDVNRDDEFYPFVEKGVRDVILHPEFVAGNLVNDIALLRLDSPVDPNLPHVNPACLPQLDESFVRENCWVTGWGKDSFGQKGSFQSVLREVELPVLGQSECESALRQTRLGPHYRLHSGFICAGGEGGRDACEGDGGSGLYCVQDGLIKVAGLVSWGIGCGQAGVPGVYVNMAHYRTWIENIISIDEDIYSSNTNYIGSNLISERSNGNGSEIAVATSQQQDHLSSSTSTTLKPPSEE